MSYEILYDRKLIQVGENQYFMLVQAGSSNCFDIVNGREILDKEWYELRLKQDKHFFTLDEIKNRIKDYTERAFGNVAENRYKFFPYEDLHKFLLGALKYPATIEQHENACNYIRIKTWDQKGHYTGIKYVNTEQLLGFDKTGLKYSIEFFNRKLNPLCIKAPKTSKRNRVPTDSEMGA